MEPTRHIVLASGSVYRKMLLEKILPNFESVSPDVDESPLPQESSRELSMRLAKTKAQALAASHPESLIIGSDQVAMLDNQQLHKPGTHQRCIEQLMAASGRCVDFFTSVCVYDAHTGALHRDLDHTQVFFKPLTPAQVERYVEREQPFDCAGGFKSEGLGIALFERIQGDDPNALIGLPLILLARLLENAGVQIL